VIDESSLLGRGTWCNPGPATLVVRPGGWLLLVPGVRRSLLESAWRVLNDPPDAGELLGRLAAGSEFETEDRLPPVIFGLGEGTSPTLGVRGTSPLAVHTAQGCTLLAGSAAEPTVLESFEDVRRIAFGELPAEEPGAALRIVEGMCRVRGFLRMCVDPSDLDDSDLADLRAQVAQEGRSIQTPETKARADRRRAEAARPAGPAAMPRVPAAAPPSAPPVEPARAPSAAPVPAAVAAEPTTSMFDELFAATPDLGVQPDPDAAPATAPAPASPATAAPLDGAPLGGTRPGGTPLDGTPRRDGGSGLGAVIGEGGSAYDDLFGRTLRRSVEEAAVRTRADAETESCTEGLAPAGTGPESTVLTHGSGADDRRRQVEERKVAAACPDAEGGPCTASSAPGDVIDRVSSIGRTPPEIVRRTVGQAPPVPARSVALPGSVCERLHANPPDAARCRWCGARILHGTRTVPRPPLGLVEISTGEQFLLDRSAIVGRRPRASRAIHDEAPQLITVPSPQQDISRSHVALLLEGWHVIAEDLSTTNGTALRRVGAAPRRLDPGESPVLEDGDVLDLGDGVTLRLHGRPS
jgi:hypothetical protein